jgi:hypothetical protein
VNPNGGTQNEELVAIATSAPEGLAITLSDHEKNVVLGIKNPARGWRRAQIISFNLINKSGT